MKHDAKRRMYGVVVHPLHYGSSQGGNGSVSQPMGDGQIPQGLPQSLGIRAGTIMQGELAVNTFGGWHNA